MRMIDPHARKQVNVLQLYLGQEEAKELVRGLSKLLAEPESDDHIHVIGRDGSEISCSIVTKRKLERGRYTQVEREALDDW